MQNPLRKRFRYCFFNANIILILINIVVFIITQKNPRLKYLLSMNPYFVVHYKFYWQILTCFFCHSDFSHIFLNMFALLIFGTHLEKSMGSKEYLLFYFLSGITSTLLALATYIFTNSYEVFLLGASGVVYAILFAFTVIFPKVKLFIFGIVPMAGPILILIYAIIELLNQLFNFNDGIAHMVHLFGFIVAWLYFIIRIGINPIKVWKNALR